MQGYSACFHLEWLCLPTLKETNQKFMKLIFQKNQYKMTKSVLFICLGNICRSPMAEAVFLDLLKKNKNSGEWLVDSAAIIDYHVGKKPDSRTTATLNKNNITDYDHRVRQISSSDFFKFDYIFGMDEDNISDLQNLLKQAGKDAKAKIELLGKYDPQGEIIIPDPYYSSDKNAFDSVYQQCLRSCDGFLKSLEK